MSRCKIVELEYRRSRRIHPSWVGFSFAFADVNPDCVQQKLLIVLAWWIVLYWSMHLYNGNTFRSRRGCGYFLPDVAGQNMYLRLRTFSTCCDCCQHTCHILKEVCYSAGSQYLFTGRWPCCATLAQKLSQWTYHYSSCGYVTLNLSHFPLPFWARSANRHLFDADRAAQPATRGDLTKRGRGLCDRLLRVCVGGQADACFPARASEGRRPPPGRQAVFCSGSGSGGFEIEVFIALPSGTASPCHGGACCAETCEGAQAAKQSRAFFWLCTAIFPNVQDIEVVASLDTVRVFVHAC